MPKFNPDPKPKKYRNQKYLDWIKGQTCLVPECNEKSEPCHVRHPHWGAGAGLKPHDYVAIQLCRSHHTYENERKYGTERQIVDNLMRYIEYCRKRK